MCAVVYLVFVARHRSVRAEIDVPRVETRPVDAQHSATRCVQDPRQISLPQQRKGDNVMTIIAAGITLMKRAWPAKRRHIAPSRQDWDARSLGAVARVIMTTPLAEAHTKNASRDAYQNSPYHACHTCRTLYKTNYHTRQTPHDKTTRVFATTNVVPDAFRPSNKKKKSGTKQTPGRESVRHHTVHVPECQAT